VTDSRAEKFSQAQHHRSRIHGLYSARAAESDRARFMLTDKLAHLLDCAKAGPVTLFVRFTPRE
jgi:hypothetical protein